MDHKICNLALSLEGVIYGGYVRDVLVCGHNKFNDIDILWVGLGRPRQRFDMFCRLLSVEWPGKVGVQRLTRRGYDGEVQRVVIQNVATIDCCIYNGTFEDWRSEHSCDFTCNLFYKSREVQLGIRYVPDYLRYEPDPVNKLLEMTRERRYNVIFNGDAWMRIVARAKSLARRGWKSNGDFEGASYREINEIQSIEDQRAVDDLVEILPELRGLCESKIREHLSLESDVSEED